jgi:hypothetical protein
MPPLRIVGGRNAASGSFRLELDQKSFARGRRLLDHYQGAPLRTRMSKAPLAAARTMESAMRQAAPVGPPGDKHRGLLRKTVRAREFRAGRGPEPYGAALGPTAGHRHLPIRGHRIVTRGGRDTGRRSRPNPFVDAVTQRHYARAVAEMRRHIFDTNYGRAL